jgi:hypothetical protein
VVGRSVWPNSPQIHVANAPVELEPEVSGFPHRFLNLAFTTAGDANVDANSKVFSAGQEGWTVLQFLDSAGEMPNPSLHPSLFEVVRTVRWNHPAHLADNQPAVIGTALDHPSHNDPTGKNGFGTKLIERSVRYELNGKVESEYGPEGLVCTIEVPWTNDFAHTLES